MEYGKTQNKNNDIKIDINSIFNNISKNDNGYCYLPGGLILQWGVNYSAGITVQQYEKNIPFNISFPNTCLNVQLTLNDAGWGANDMYCGIGMASKNKDNFNITLKTTRTGINYSVYIYWIAIGY